jgi:predicted transcriptional regulator
MEGIPMSRLALTILMLSTALLAGCEMLGIESPEKVAAARDAEGRAVGGACRHAGRAIEDCYVMNRKADKAAVFAGWRDMNDYMRENNMEAVAPELSAQNATKAADASGEKTADKATGKTGDKKSGDAATKPKDGKG